MPIDRNAFIDNFLSEAGENIASMETSILALKHDGENKNELATLMRALHTLKGSSRMLKFHVVETVTHSLENVLKGIRDGRYPLGPAVVRLVMVSCDYLRRALERIRSDRDDGIPLDSLIETCRQAEDNEPFGFDWYRDAKDGGVNAVSPADGVPPRGETVLSSGTKDVTLQAIGNAADSIRIKTSRVDSILKMHNDLIVNQFLLKQENERYAEMEESCRELASREGDASGGERRPEFLLLAQLSAARSRFREQMQVVEESARAVQRELLSLRMLPVSLVLGPLPSMVEETAASLGKDIVLVMTGTELALDRMVLEHLQDPVIHIVRNSIDHGIESPALRKESGKEASGSIRIDCTVESGNFVMRIQDDGQGLDYERIRRKAVERGMLQEDEAASATAQSLNRILFESGFSTRDESTELSGRGVGLDIVRHEIELVKGRISLESERGRGTVFTLVLPLSLATVEGFFVRVGERKFLVPSAYIREITRYSREDEVLVLNRRSILLRDSLLPVYHLATLVGSGEEAESAAAHVLVVEYLGDQAGIIVDEVLQHASLVSKPMPPAMTALKPVQGFVYDENFSMVSILVVPELMQRFRKGRDIDSRKRFSSDSPEYRHILVVDDSFSTREIEKSILALEGYSVETAVDGIEALEILRSGHFDLVVSDLNMPRMDGATLVENMRRDGKFRNIPVVIVSSESETAKRLSLMSLGANSFITKADFDRGHLAQEVRYLLAQTDAKNKRSES
jgi:Chemotaxis protein histidine kinase and related kinases